MVVITTGEDPPAFFPLDSDYHDEFQFDDDGNYILYTFPDWIAYLEFRWDEGMRCATLSPWKDEDPHTPHEIEFPLQYEFSSFSPNVVISPPWVQHCDPRFQKDMLDYDI
ncbi:hypothetical protein D9613_001249 [Agrocybe pediades]|uniref:Uncharacterized protein n=1 Tax=Agrocybe pediades TaxID=84607 RepID=A0A8H4R081_9AGAR|nr:hypothetical protein D9613_001249 [Agrocybe pediades]